MTLPPLNPDRVCPWWLVWTFDNPIRQLFHSPYRIFRDWVFPGQSVLDIGCGAGYFSIGLARLVGPRGKVIAADIQPEMLELVEIRSKHLGLQDQIQPHLCQPEQLELEERFDFILTFWMMHEVPNQKALLEQIHNCLKPGGHYLLAEPKGHVHRRDFDTTLIRAQGARLRVIRAPRIMFSRTALFMRAEDQPAP